MKKIKNKVEYDELIGNIRECLKWYERKNFDDKVFILTLDNGEKLKIMFTHNTIAHLLGIDTEYLKSTGVFTKDSYEILKLICNDSYRLYNMIIRGHLTYDSFISEYTSEKLEGFQSICGIDLYNMEFACKYSKEYSYVTGHPQLGADYYIGYKANNGLYIIGLKRNGNYYYPMTNRYIDYSDEETTKFLNQLLEKQRITMPTLSSIYFKENDSYSKNLYLDYNKKTTKIRILNNYAQKYDATVDVGVGYNFALEKLIKKFDDSSAMTPIMEKIFEYITKRIKIDVNEIEKEFGKLSEDTKSLINSYNESLNTDIGAALDEHTKYVMSENNRLSEENQKHIEELEALKQQLLEAKSIIEGLREENTEYKTREEETITAMKRIYKL